jgi:hypothetical protein
MVLSISNVTVYMYLHVDLHGASALNAMYGTPKLSHLLLGQYFRTGICSGTSARASK